VNAFRHDFQTADGHLQYPQPNGLYYALAPANPAFLGPLLSLFLLVGLWSARRWSLSAWLLLVGWSAIVYAFHAGAPWQNFRFTLAYLPPLAILVAAGVRSGWTQLTRLRLRAALLAYTVLGVALIGIGAVRLVEGFIDRKADDLALVAWVQARTPSQAQLLTFGPTLAFRHYTNLPTFDLFDLNTAEVGSLVSRPAPTYLLVDEASVESQWLGQSPSNNLHALRDGPGLTELGNYDGYSLYAIERAAASR
jgi:hypothetical protein